MAVAFTQLSWWLWSGKKKEPIIPKGSSLNSSPESRRVRRKWRSREERKIDREYDVVLVPSEGVCVSGSESEDSDWSVGWLEPLGPGFPSDDDADDSFAVLVPCYGHVIHDMVKDSKNNFLSTVGNIPDGHSDESTKYMEEWLSSLRNS
ncbi:hypothetical protein TB2_044080 [Malus domestica]